MKLLYKELRSVLAAHRALDGLMKNGELDPYLFSCKVTWNKSKNLELLEREVNRLEKIRRERIAAISGGRGKNVPADKETQFALDWEDFLETEVEINGLLKLSHEDLNVFDPKENPTGNKIPSTVLTALRPLILEPAGKT